MRISSSVHRSFLWATLLVVAVVGTFLWESGSTAQPASAATGLVPDAVRTDLPIALDGTVFDIEQMGNRIIVAGSFTQVRPSPGAAPIDQAYLYAYDINTGAFDAGFTPTVDREIEQIVPAPDGSGLYLVGAFNTIDGTRIRKIARLNQDGSLDVGFKANGDAKATAVAISPDGSRLFVGGKFTTVAGQPRAGLVELDAATGAVASDFTIGISGPIGVGGGMTVKGLAVTPDGRELVVMSSSRFIGDQERYGLGKINLTTSPASMKGWRTRLFENNKDRVGGQFWLRGFDLSPDGKYFVVTTSGGDRPPTNDVAIRFPVRGGGGDDIQPDWITRNFDSTYAAAIDDDVVYIGGHFQYTEAPGAMDPYPGDPEKSYGFGGDQDASILGNQVIARKQVAALDPATGHSIGWNPGANGFNGVYALEIIDRGLLLGHDGDIVGDKPVGRAAFFDRDNPGNGNEGGGGGGGADVVLDTSVTSPLTGSQFDEDTTITIEGVATSPDNVSKVQVTVYDLANRTWMQPDGSFASPWSASLATLATPGATTSSWQLPIVLPAGGEYEIKAKTFDQAGAKDATTAKIRIRANTVGVDEAPDTFITAAIVDNDARTISVMGTATDDVGVANVKLAFIYRTQLGTQYLQADGSLGDYYAFKPVLSDPGQPGTNWSVDVTVPVDGSWTMQAFAKDVAGQQDASKARATRVVGADATDEAPSLVRIDQPTVDALAVGQGFTVAGVAEDDIGVDRVLVQVVNLATGEGLQLGGTIGGIDGVARGVDATLANRGSTSTTWSTDVPGLPPGRYRVSARAYDTFPKSRLVYKDINVLTSPDESLPTILFTTPTAGDVLDPTITATGVATDNSGVARVEVAYYFRGSAEQSAGYLRADNTISNVPQFRDAVLASPGATSTTWSDPARTMPFEGAWFVRARSWDDAGQPSNDDVYVYYTYRPNDAPPTIEVDSLADGDLIAPGPLAVNGAIFDDQGVRSVRYYVRRTLLNEGPNPDANVTTANWFAAFVTQPGGIRSNFAFTSPDLEPGSWFVFIEGFDDAGQVSARTRINFTVGFDGNVAPDVRVVSPVNQSSDAQSLTMTFSGTATDDVGVAEVRLLVYDATNRGFIRLEGGVTGESAKAYHSATLSAPGSAATDWTYSITLPQDGRYYVRAVAYDNLGMRQITNRYSWFWVTPGDTKPTAEILSPANGAVVPGSFTVSGVSTDDVEVNRVRLLVRNEDNRAVGLRADGTVTSSAQWLEIDITAGQTVNWAKDLDLPPGRWRLDVLSYDSTAKFIYAAAKIVTVN